MDVENRLEAMPVMTPEEQGIFFDLLKQQMPS